MRIALATSSYAPHVGGVEEHVRNLADVLRRRGHEIAVWTVARDGKFSQQQRDGVQVWNLPAPLPARTLRDVAQFATAAPRAWSQWNRAFRALKPDVIHVHCFGPNGTYANALAARHQTTLMVSSHGETLADDAGVFEHSRLAQTSLRSAVHRSAIVTGCSRVVLADLEARFGLDSDKGFVVPNGIDLHETTTADTSASVLPGVTGRYVAAVGRLQRVKGFDLLVHAFARAQLGADVSLVIGGDGPERTRLRELAVQNGIGHQLVLPGQLSRGQVAELLRNAAAVAVPSRFEAFGIAALETWRAETPLIVTNRGGPPEFVTHEVDGLLCDPTAIDTFAAFIATVLDNSSFARTLAENGRRRVESFTWDHTASAYEALYAQF
ncbi:glycosyltransferase family 4 protein [Paramicrobacterium fandaimingii]|uniref:glycosyltransferase family 4 protein n=1 Tax=Paramicrobacterium fandaimingii TaxID=2708079 RepID=UPI00141DBEB3|nr:glycosyltransferase family 4 protein [Microbacterium fandaimingii]